MKKNTSLVIMTFLAVLGLGVSTAGGSSSVAGPVVANPQTTPGTPNLQQAPPSDSQKADTSPQTGVPATTKPSTTGNKMIPITDDYTPFTEPFILLP